jgi:hypothetical protein
VSIRIGIFLIRVTRNKIQIEFYYARNFRWNNHVGHTGEGEIYEYKYDERYVVKATKTTKGTAICRMKLRFINLSNQSLDLSRLGRWTIWHQERNCGSATTRFESLEYIHSSGYIHGDVIAENVLVSGNKVVLGDFGWATEWFNRIDHDLLAYERIMIRLITGQWYNYDVWFAQRWSEREKDSNG